RIDKYLDNNLDERIEATVQRYLDKHIDTNPDPRIDSNIDKHIDKELTTLDKETAVTESVGEEEVIEPLPDEKGLSGKDYPERN
nr:hypothetical protein [Crocosphaera sp.]